MNRSLINRLSTAIVAAALTAFASSNTFAQQSNTSQVPNSLENDPVYRSWRNQVGVQGCGRCHSEGNAFATDRSFSRQNELSFWINHDKHAIARRRVEPLSQEELINEAQQLESQLDIEGVPADWFGASNVLSKRICKELGYDVSSSEGYAKFRNNCLTCHGGYTGEGDDQDFAKDGGAQPGISCNYCHQLGDKKEWVAAHGLAEGTSWRLKSPDEKAEAGMHDLVTVHKQASLCFDCHIGNRSTNQFVTHEMYAAGHPPLPSIELHTFCDQMPQHWQTPSELLKSLEQSDSRDDYFKTNYPGVVDSIEGGKVFWNTRKMIIGALAARKQSLQLFVDSSEPDQWADYSLYDCAACHHELRSDSRRQRRGYPGPPGRPRQHEWPAALLESAMDLAGTADAMATNQLEQQLQVEFGAKPFGHQDKVRAAARTLAERMDAAIAKVESMPIDAAAARSILTKLASTPERKLLTYDSARQVVWAMQTIADELEAQGESLPEEVRQQIRALGQKETAGIETKLPAGRDLFIYSDALARDLRLRSEFDPQSLKAKLQAIAENLK